MRIPRVSSDGVNRLYLLLFYAVGSLAAQLSPQAPALSALDACPPVLVLLLPIVASLFLASSAAGVILIPLVSLGLGAVCGASAAEIVSACAQQGSGTGRTLLALILSVSVFFCIAVRGMQISSVLCACLERQRSADGGSLLRPLLPMTAAVLLTGAILYFL